MVGIGFCRRCVVKLVNKSARKEQSRDYALTGMCGKPPSITSFAAALAT